MTEVTSLIDEFIASYQREFDFYQTTSQLCASRCETLLSENGIRGLVTYRAKRPERLRQKLSKREREREISGESGYQSIQDIRADIVDFSGVRVALYFPGDRARFNALVSEAFRIIVSREFPSTTIPVTQPDQGHVKRFSGYHATHHRVRLVSSQSDPLADRYLDIPTEIQVASVLMHAWSEVEHDLVYKPLSGVISVDEYAILDAINGMVLSGEVALELLQRAVETRVGSRETTLSSQYELAAFLYEEFKQKNPTNSSPVMGRVDLLFQLIVAAKLDRSADLRTYIHATDKSGDAYPVADQMIDGILNDHPELYERYLAIREDRAAAPVESDPSLHMVLLGQFVSAWRKFDLLARELQGTEKAGSPADSFDSVVSLVEDSVLQDRLRQLRLIRNLAIHGRDLPTSASLSRGTDDLDSIFEKFRTHTHDNVRNAMEKVANLLNTQTF